MNQQERDELRDSAEKAIRFQSLDAARQATSVIRVLDAWEAEVHDGSEVSTTREVCDHVDWNSAAYSEGIYVDMGYRYCPKCGEKL